MKTKIINLFNYLIKKNAMLGVFIGMFLESSFVPIPSEAVLLAFGTTVPVRVVVIAGSIGSTAGGVLGYFIGRVGGDALVESIGPYIDVDKGKVKYVADKLNDSKTVTENLKQKFPWMPGWFFEKIFTLGGLLVLGSRCVPFIPFKIFSISSGLVHIDVFTFIIYTLIGSIPRCWILATIGKKLEPWKKPVLMGIGAVVLLYLVYIFALKPLVHGKPQPETNLPAATVPAAATPTIKIEPVEPQITPAYPQAAPSPPQPVSPQMCVPVQPQPTHDPGHKIKKRQAR